MSNRLSQETSPYLLQHAENPVDWYPWGQEALAAARKEYKPIFLSVGYAACHWCHVMAHESFEDERVAAYLNANFVSVKVDREERPDLDSVYMAAVQAMTGSGGWPMSVFLTPEGVPFYGGTYFPPESRHGLPSFLGVLSAVMDAWKMRRLEVVAGGERLLAAIESASEQSVSDATGSLDSGILAEAVANLRHRLDRVRGGWGSAPKFPQPMILEFLLRYHLRSDDPDVLEMVTKTLDSMAHGGVYDQLGGGFHRYSVDQRWLVPHYEKMLYDNAQLARVYLHAWQVTGKPLYRAITKEILDYIVREMTDPLGGFYSTQDADSEGEEGKFFLWTLAEIREHLGSDASEFIKAYGITAGGNFEGRNVLEFVGEPSQRERLRRARDKLLGIRERRVHPGRDEKILTSWNGLMLAAFAEAARIFSREDYQEIAERNARFLLEHLSSEEGRLYRTWKAGEAKLNGYLEDYSHLAEGLLELYRTTFENRWYFAAQSLLDHVLEHFVAQGGGFFDTSDEHEALVIRPKDLQDGAIPSGNAMAVTVLLRLASLAGEPRYRDSATQALKLMAPSMSDHPLGYGQWLIALQNHLSKSLEIAIVGDPGIEETRALLRIAEDGYGPHRIIAVGMSAAGAPVVPMLADRPQVNGLATAYVCRNFNCLWPVTVPAELESLVKD